MKVFQIVNSKGLYSSGGLDVKWGKEGKIWHRKQDVKSHLKMVNDFYNRRNKMDRNPYRKTQCFIAEYRLEFVDTYEVNDSY
jgi:hypothetical protein